MEQAEPPIDPASYQRTAGSRIALAAHAIVVITVVLLNAIAPSVLGVALAVVPESIQAIAPWYSFSVSNRAILAPLIGPVAAEQFYAFHYVLSAVAMTFFLTYVVVGIQQGLGSSHKVRAVTLLVSGLFIALLSTFSGDALWASDGSLGRLRGGGAMAAAMWFWPLSLGVGVAASVGALRRLRR